MENREIKKIGHNNSKKIRDRLLDAAEELFAAKGFNGASVRDITSKANGNVAAVNYHFGSKEKLYHGVFLRRMRVVTDMRLETIKKVMSQTDHEVTLEELLKEFSIAFLRPFLDEETGSRFIRLMIQEMTHPRLPKEMFMHEIVEPTLKAFGKALSKIVSDLEPKQIMLATMSLAGQLLHIIRLKEMFDVEELTSHQIPDFDEIIEHIVVFTAAGIRSMVKAGN
ncbi:MAG: CerR family C-terminal domain-containing protein [Planctomycetota bacterium]